MNPQGIYTLVSRGNTLDRQMDTVANNLANVNTVGYKQDQPAFELLFSQTMGVPQESDEEVFATHEHLAPYTGVGTFHVAVADMGKNFDEGRLEATGNDLDFALTTPGGFFSISTPSGERYTRAGNFKLNADGTLITADGFPVNGKEGPLQLEGNEVRLTESGSVLVDGREVGGLRVVEFPFPERLQKFGGTLYAPVDAENTPRIMEEPRLVQGMVESSNVDSVKEMVRMIEANRAYTTMQKALTASDEMNQRAISLAQV